MPNPGQSITRRPARAAEWIVLAKTTFSALLIAACGALAERTPVHFPRHPRSSANMSILVQTVSGLVLTDSTELAVFSSEGVFAGSTVLEGSGPWGVAAWGNDEVTPDVDGLLPGDSLQFMVWDPVSALELPAHATYEMGSPFYAADALAIVHLTVATTPIPSPPRWRDLPGPVQRGEGSLIEFEVLGWDPNGDPLTIAYSTPNLPPAATFADLGGGRGKFSWQTTRHDAGDYSALFTLSDRTFSVDADVSIKVLPAPSQPDDWTLDGPFPNPFKVLPAFRFQLSEDSDVRLEVRDLSGRYIGTVFDADLAEGVHWSRVNLPDWPPGVYYFSWVTPAVTRTVAGVRLR